MKVIFALNLLYLMQFFLSDSKFIRHQCNTKQIWQDESSSNRGAAIDAGESYYFFLWHSYAKAIKDVVVLSKLTYG